MKTVFFVDDDGLLREMLARSLDKHNYAVKTFGQPRDLLRGLDTCRPDVIISDIQMPEIGGLELIQIIRERGFDIPIIVMSGHVTREVKRRASDLGVRRVVSKPIKDFSQLAAVDQHLDPDDAVARPRLGETVVHVGA